MCIYKALSKLGAGWIVDEDYEKAHGDEDEADDYDGSPRSHKHGSSASIDPLKLYKLPADPWHIKIRWATESTCFCYSLSSKVD